MAKPLLILLSITLLACNYKQELSPNQKLYLTAKVWGFLKYYHPEVNKGKLNWDNELVGIVKKLPEINSKKELSSLYLKWIESMGEIDPAVTHDTAKSDSSFDKNFDLSWFRNEYFSQELSDRLVYIEQHRSKALHYVRRAPVGQIEITNEPVYTTSQWNDRNIRLTMLFRYWNVIEYFYPYKYKMDRDWDDILQTFIPRLTDVRRESDYHLALHELTVSLCDSHAFFVTDSVKAIAGKKYISSRFKILNDKAVFTEFYDDSLAKLDDLLLGDAVTKVNGILVSDIYLRNEKYINGSNEAVKRMGYASRWIFNGNTDTVRITYERKGKASSKTIRRYDRSTFKSPPSQRVKWKRLNGTIGYVNMEEILAEDLPGMMKELNGMKAIIFDFRNYPEFIIDDLLTYLNAEPHGFARFIQPDLTYPGRFEWTEVVQCGKQNPSPYKGKVIILVNEDTQSRSEYFVMAMQTVKGAVTIGRQTSSADGDVLDFTFFDDKTSWITGRGVFYPDGRETQRVGIKLDVEVPLALEDIKSGRDAIMEKAVEAAIQMK